MKKVDDVIASTFEKLRRTLGGESYSNIKPMAWIILTFEIKWILPLLKALRLSNPVFTRANIKSDSGIEYQIPYKGWDKVNMPRLYTWCLPRQDFD